MTVIDEWKLGKQLSSALIGLNSSINREYAYQKGTTNLQTTAFDVFVNRRGKASLVEGYVDGPSLRQVVADAR